MRETYAMTYDRPGDDGEFGVDLIHADVDSDGYRTEAGWTWIRADDTDTWDLEDVDALLAENGWRRVEEWTYLGETGVGPGHEAKVTPTEEKVMHPMTPYGRTEWTGGNPDEFEEQ